MASIYGNYFVKYPRASNVKMQTLIDALKQEHFERIY